jgi:acyl carrier protein
MAGTRRGAWPAGSEGILSGLGSADLREGPVTVDDPLIDLFAEGLRVDSNGLTEETSPQNTPQWDSLAAMTLITLIEDSFAVRLSTREIMKMNSIGAARSVLRSKGVADI